MGHAVDTATDYQHDHLIYDSLLFKRHACFWSHGVVELRARVMWSLQHTQQNGGRRSFASTYILRSTLHHRSFFMASIVVRPSHPCEFYMGLGAPRMKEAGPHERGATLPTQGCAMVANVGLSFTWLPFEGLQTYRGAL